MLAERPDIFQVELSPDGGAVAYRVNRKSLASNETVMEWYLQEITPLGEALPPPILLPKGATYVEWLPNSKGMSMILPPNPSDKGQPHGLVVRNRESGKLLAIRIQGALQTEGVTDMRVTGPYYWSPTGRYVAFTAPIDKGGGKNPRKGVTVGEWKRLARHGLFILEIATGTVKQVTPPGLVESVYNYRGISWAPNERQIAAVVIGTSVFSRSQVYGDIAICDIERGTMRELVSRPGWEAFPMWSPDGKWIAFSTQNGKASWNGMSLDIVAADSGVAMQLSREIGRPVIGEGWWAPDSSAYLTYGGRDFNRQLVRIGVTDRNIALVSIPEAAGELPYDGDFSFSRDRRWVAFSRSSLTTQCELFVAAVEADGRTIGVPRRLTKLGEDFALNGKARVELLRWRAPDGKHNIGGLLLTPMPPSTDPKPLIVLHPGGTGDVRRAINYDGFGGLPLALAARGYAVLVPSHRGRTGEDFALGANKATGPLPYADWMAGVDLLVGRGVADPEKLGTVGHSWGAYNVTYAVAHSPRFKAAVMHEGSGSNLLLSEEFFADPAELLLMTNYRDSFGISDPFAPDQIKQLIDDSPLLLVKAASTPCLLQFSSGADTKGLSLFNALGHGRTPSAMFVYDDGHGFNRPANRADDITRVGEWLDYWVRGIAYPNAERAEEYNAWKVRNRKADEVHELVFGASAKRSVEKRER